MFLQPFPVHHKQKQRFYL